MQLTASGARAPARIGALASGGGRTVVNIAEACARGEVPARVAVCVVTRGDAEAAARCRAAGIAVEVVAPEPAATFDDRVDAALRAHGVDFVCLCGYLRRFRVDAWRGRALNIHPALLPDFGGPGMWGERVHRAVLDAGRAETGCTVHWVDEEYDRGAPVLQRRCPVLPGDTPATLAARVFAEECSAYPEALRAALGGALRPT
ncbi:MAG: phosphoribosylglycinamide formyltransferase [Actinobacteria bacterium]|nr:phosphoribosylglycinamide formyltransferase [Actinomycetota bacterium]